MLIRVSFISRPTLLLLWKPWRDSGSANALHVSVTKTVLQQEWRVVYSLFTVSSPGVLTSLQPDFVLISLVTAFNEASNGVCVKSHGRRCFSSLTHGQHLMSYTAAYHIHIVWMCAMTHLHATALHSVCMLPFFFLMALIKHIACLQKARRHSSRQPCGVKCHVLYPTTSKGPRTLTIALRQMNLDVGVWLSGKVLAQRVAPVSHGCMTGEKNEGNLSIS